MIEIGKSMILLSVFMTPLLAILLLAAKPLRKRYRPQFFLALWLILALRLLIPLTSVGIIQLEIPVAESNQKTFMSAQTEQTQPKASAIPGAPDNQDFPSQTMPTDVYSLIPAPKTKASLLSIAIWFYWCVAASMLLWYLTGWICFSAKLHKHRRRMKYRTEAREICTSRCQKMGLRRPIELYQCPALTSPMVVGIFRPALYLPDTAYSRAELQLILAHELTHIRKGHLVWKWVLLLAKVIHWFNPLVWLLSKRAQQDMELCCDELVSQHLDEEDRKFYGRTILSAICQSRPLQRYATGYSGGGDAIRERFQVVFGKAGSKGGAVLLIVLVLALALSGCLGFAPAPAQSPVPPQAQVQSPEKESPPEAIPAEEAQPTQIPVPEEPSSLSSVTLDTSPYLSLTVPAAYENSIRIRSPYAFYVQETGQSMAFENSLYTFYDTSQANHGFDGFLWAICIYEMEDMENVMAYDQADGERDYTIQHHVLGTDGEMIYALATLRPFNSGTCVQFDDSSRESVTSYLRHMEDGIQILDQFVSDHQLTVPDGIVDWKLWYQEHLLEPVQGMLNKA